MSKVPGFNKLADFDDRIAKRLTRDVYVTVELDGEEDAYISSWNDKAEAVESTYSDEDKCGIVATYKLVKVEYLRLQRTVEVVKAEE